MALEYDFTFMLDEIHAALTNDIFNFNYQRLEILGDLIKNYRTISTNLDEEYFKNNPKQAKHLANCSFKIDLFRYLLESHTNVFTNILDTTDE